MLKKAVFLDRDGVLNINHGHVHKKEHFEWVTGAIEALKFLNESQFLTIIITNQAGIAKGFYSEDIFHEFMSWILHEAKSAGATIDAYYFCPHHPTEGIGELLKDCDCRKPKPGMILKAMNDFEIDPAKSVFIGDKQSDMEAAESAGVRGLLFDEENLFEFVKKRFA